MSGAAARPPARCAAAPRRLALDARVERYADGRVLLDPRNARVVRLSASGVAALGRLLEAGATSRAEAALAERLVTGGLAHPCPAPGTSGLGERVSVVVPVRDRPDALGRCLAALGEAGPPGLEVVVVDDGSADAARTAAVCAAYGARCVRLRPGRGPGAARNAGVATVVRPLVALVDSDCRPRAGWLEPLAALLEDPAVAAAAPRVAAVTGGRGWRARYVAARSPLDLGAAPAEVRRNGRVSYVPTAALLVRRSALDEGFDERLRYGEDVDLVWRLLDEGGRVRYEPRGTVDHDEPGTWRALLARRFRYGTSAGPLALRHRRALAPLRVAPWPGAAVLAALAGRPAAAAALVGIPAARLARTLAPRQVPAARAVRLVLEGALETAEATGRAATMLAWPVLAVAVARGGGGRRAAAALVLVPALRDWRRRRPRLDPCRFALASAADDVAYGCGVWWGAIRARSAGPLVPLLTRSSLRRSRASRR